MTTTPEVIDLHAVAHPSTQVRRAGFPLDHPYLEQCWAPLIGPSSVLLLRHCVSLWRDATPARVPTEDLARQIGLGRGTGRHSPLWHTIERVVHFRFASDVHSWRAGHLHRGSTGGRPPARPPADLVTRPARTSPRPAPRRPRPIRRTSSHPERAAAPRPNGPAPRPPHQPRRGIGSNPRPMIVPRRRPQRHRHPVPRPAATPHPSSPTAPSPGQTLAGSPAGNLRDAPEQSR